MFIKFNTEFLTLFFTLFYKLLCGHALADFVLQPDVMARGKNREEDSPIPWYYWLGVHALIHSGVVLIITNSLYFALMEVIIHFICNFIKGETRMSIHIDQAVHVFMKLLYCIMFFL